MHLNYGSESVITSATARRMDLDEAMVFLTFKRKDSPGAFAAMKQAEARKCAEQLLKAADEAAALDAEASAKRRNRKAVA